MLATRRERTKHELRCFCRGTPLLAMYGIERDGTLYVHVKIYKQGRVYGETYHKDGIVLLRCRNCLRWNRVTFTSPVPSNLLAKLEETGAPPMVAEQNPV